MHSTRFLIAGTAVALLAPAAAHAATLQTDQSCYLPGQSMGIAGSGWTAGSAWTVKGSGIFASGAAAADGTFTTSGVKAPDLANSASPKPKTITLTGTQDGTAVATTTFQVVNFLVRPKSTNGKPTGMTTWVFSGFAAKSTIFFHIVHNGHTYTQKIGRTSSPCGTLTKRLRRLPAVPPRKISYGKYKVYVDSRRKFSRGGYQYGPATITIYKKFT